MQVKKLDEVEAYRSCKLCVPMERGVCISGRERLWECNSRWCLCFVENQGKASKRNLKLFAMNQANHMYRRYVISGRFHALH